MSSPAFVVTPYYENFAPYATQPEEAVTVYGAAIEYIAVHTGPIALRAPEAITSPKDDYPLLLPSELPLKYGEHSALLTRGPIDICGNDVDGFSNPIGASSQLLVRWRRRLLGAEMAAARVAVHELGHSFGLVYGDAGKADHCPDTACIMYEELGPPRRGRALLKGDPFCGDCSEQLHHLGAAGVAKSAGDIG